MSLTADLIVTLLNGLQLGAIYILVAIGLSIILGALKFVNFAHGALFLIGTYVGLLITQKLPLAQGQLHEQFGLTEIGLGWGFLPALIIVPIIVFVLGLLMERFLARPFYDRSDTDQILFTFGIALIIQELIRVMFSSRTYQFDRPDWAAGPVTLPVVGNFAKWRLYVIVITAMLVLLTYAVLEYTDLGLVVRAGTIDTEMVRLMGIKVTRPYLVVFAFGAALAGAAGVIGGPLETVDPLVGMNVLVPAFLVVVIGGVGSLTGAVIGGIMIGETLAILVAIAPKWSQIGIYALAAIILLVRPQGLLGREVLEE